jgi:hypothetical protein
MATIASLNVILRAQSDLFQRGMKDAAAAVDNFRNVTERKSMVNFWEGEAAAVKKNYMAAIKDLQTQSPSSPYYAQEMEQVRRLGEQYARINAVVKSSRSQIQSFSRNVTTGMARVTGGTASFHRTLLGISGLIGTSNPALGTLAMLLSDVGRSAKLAVTGLKGFGLVGGIGIAGGITALAGGFAAIASQLEQVNGDLELSIRHLNNIKNMNIQRPTSERGKTLRAQADDYRTYLAEIQKELDGRQGLANGVSQLFQKLFMLGGETIADTRYQNLLTQQSGAIQVYTDLIRKAVEEQKKFDAQQALLAGPQSPLLTAVEDVAKAFDFQAATIGKTANEIEIYKLQVAGADDLLQKFVRDKANLIDKLNAQNEALKMETSLRNELDILLGKTTAEELKLAELQAKGANTDTIRQLRDSLELAKEVRQEAQAGADWLVNDLIASQNNLKNFAQSVQDSLKTPIDRFKEFRDQIDQAVNAGLLSSDQGLSALQNKMKDLMGGKSAQGEFKTVDTSLIDIRGLQGKDDKIVTLTQQQVRILQNMYDLEKRKLTTGSVE